MHGSRRSKPIAACLQNEMISVGRFLPACGSHGTRIVCVGGYSDQIAAVTMGIATLWSGVHVVKVSQSLPMELQQSFTGKFDWETFLPRVRAAFRLAALRDARCSTALTAVCG